METGNHLDQFDIRIYSLSSGRAIIGELLYGGQDGLHLAGPLIILSADNLEASRDVVMVPLVPGNSNFPTTIEENTVESVTHASDALKERFLKLHDVYTEIEGDYNNPDDPVLDLDEDDTPTMFISEDDDGWEYNWSR